MGLLKGRGLFVFVCCIVFYIVLCFVCFFGLLGCCFVLGIAYLFAVWLLCFLFLLLFVLFFCMCYAGCWVMRFGVSHGVCWDVGGRKDRIIKG